MPVKTIILYIYIYMDIIGLVPGIHTLDLTYMKPTFLSESYELVS